MSYDDNKKPFESGLNLVYGDDNKWMPIDWQKRAFKQCHSGQMNHNLLICIETVDELVFNFHKEKYEQIVNEALAKILKGE